MVKSVLSVSHQGLRDWIIQRVTAIVMAVYCVGIIVFFFKNTEITFDVWHSLFSQPWVKIATILFLLSILYHAWIGIWTVFTDYVKCYVLRCILNTIVILALVSFFFDGLLILWGIA